MRHESGDVSATMVLAFMFYEGLGVTQSYEEAAELYWSAAEQGDAKAQCNLGMMYQKGIGVP